MRSSVCRLFTFGIASEEFSQAIPQGKGRGFEDVRQVCEITPHR